MLLVLCGLLTLVGLGGLIAWSFLPASSPAGGESSVPLEFVVQDEPRSQIIDRLAQDGLVESPQLMKAYAALLTPGLDFPARSHLLARGLTPREILQRLGEASRPAVKVTFPEGFSRFSMAQRLETRGICAARAFLQETTSPSLLASLGVRADSAEGYLFPSTYEFRQDERPERVVKKMVKEGLARLRTEIEAAGGLSAELRSLNLGAHEVLILASIIEKETAEARERPRIARVFLNRLKDVGGVTAGRLQSDPTASYGCRVLGRLAPASCQGASGEPTPLMLRDPENPYNTYRRPGLPPGPICNPGAEAVEAVLRAPPSQELFFVADGQGSHTFSETYGEHQKAVQKLRKSRP